MDLYNFHFTVVDEFTINDIEFITIYVSTDKDYKLGFESSDIPIELKEYLESKDIYELSIGYYETKINSLETLRKAGAIIHKN